MCKGEWNEWQRVALTNVIATDISGFNFQLDKESGHLVIQVRSHAYAILDSIHLDTKLPRFENCSLYTLFTKGLRSKLALARVHRRKSNSR